MTARPIFHPEGTLRPSDRALFCIPRFPGASALSAHLPLLFWLAEQLRPRACVTLGDAAGPAHFALCEAIERIGTGGHCHGFGPWPGGTVPDALRRHRRAHHRSVSTLRAALGPDDADGAPAAVDLLVAARPRPGSAAEAALAAWLDRLAPGGVALLAGEGPPPAGARPRLTVPHGGGLAVLAAGDALPAPVRRLLASGPGQAADLEALRGLADLHVGPDRAADRFRDLALMTERLAEQDATWRRRFDALAEERDAEAEAAADLARRLQAQRRLHRDEVEAERRAARARAAEDPDAPAPAPLETLGRLARRLTR